MTESNRKAISRRNFLVKSSIGAVAATGFPFVRTSRAQQVKPIRIGVCGCGGRGSGAAANALSAAPGVQLIAMADPFSGQIEKSLKALKSDEDLQKKGLVGNIEVAEDHIFTGMDCYRKILETDIDYVILAEPPGFRPQHFEAAVEAGKHIFAEKPLGTDPVGVRKIRTAAEKAKERGLSVVVGLNYRHDLGAQETVKRIHDGQAGKVLAGRIYRLGQGLWHRGSSPGWSQMEYQCRNWYYFCWLSGDQIVEMVIHHIDLMNWAMGGPPVRALGSGGRQQRTQEKYGNIWDHMTIDYEYPGGVHVSCMLRQWNNCDTQTGNVVVGSQGESDSLQVIRGQNRWRYPGERTNHSVLEHTKLIESIRKGKPINNVLDFGADSTLTAIMGRESAYTGMEVTWEEMLSSELDLFPESTEFGPAPQRPVPIPGQPRPQ